MKRIDNQKSVYSTSDLATAAAISLFAKPLRLEVSGNRVIFQFPKEKGEEVAAKFWAGQLKTDARKFMNSVKVTKDLLFAKLRELP